MNVFGDGTLSNVDQCLSGIDCASGRYETQYSLSELRREKFLSFGGKGWSFIPQDQKMDGQFHPMLFDKEKELAK